MGIDDGIFAKIRRSGYAGTDAAKRQYEDDVKARGYSDQDVRRTEYERLSDEKLHKHAEDSHQAHKAVTGTPPDND